MLRTCFRLHAWEQHSLMFKRTLLTRLQILLTHQQHTIRRSIDRAVFMGSRREETHPGRGESSGPPACQC